MKERLIKLFGLLMFLILTGVIISLGISSASTTEKNNFSGIEISGDVLLSADDYLRFTGFNDTTSLKDITLPQIKIRFEKHPYIVKADIEFDGESKILVELKERNFVAVLYDKQKFKLLTENYEAVPILKNTAFYELPIVTNPKAAGKSKTGKSTVKVELVQAFKIIDALKFCDEEMYSNLAEINLHKGGDVILTFTGLKFPVIFGRGYEAKKVLMLKALWNDIQNPAGIYSGMDYLDLRFNKQVFIGKHEITESNG